MNTYIEQRIKQLEEQLSSPECNNPIKVEHKLEAYKEIQQQLKNCNLQNVSFSEAEFCECEIDTQKIEMTLTKCCSCGKIVND